MKDFRSWSLCPKKRVQSIRSFYTYIYSLCEWITHAGARAPQKRGVKNTVFSTQGRHRRTRHKLFMHLLVHELCAWVESSAGIHVCSYLDLFLGWDVFFSICRKSIYRLRWRQHHMSSVGQWVMVIRMDWFGSFCRSKMSRWCNCI